MRHIEVDLKVLHRHIDSVGDRNSIGWIVIVVQRLEQPGHIGNGLVSNVSSTRNQVERCYDILGGHLSEHYIAKIEMYSIALIVHEGSLRIRKPDVVFGFIVKSLNRAVDEHAGFHGHV